jgi:hypothetical protein
MHCKILNPDFAKSSGNTPIFTAKQEFGSLRFTEKRRLAPRVDLLGANRRRKDSDPGGFGRFIEKPLGPCWAAPYDSQRNQAFYNQMLSTASRTLQFPYPFPAELAQLGTQFFQSR